MLDDERIETLKGSDRESERTRGRWLEFLAEAQASIQHGSGPRKNKYDPRYFLEYDPPEEPLDEDDDYIEPEEIEDDY